MDEIKLLGISIRGGGGGGTQWVNLNKMIEVRGECKHSNEVYYFLINQLLSLSLPDGCDIHFDVDSIEPEVEHDHQPDNPIYSMNKFVTNKSKLPQNGAQVFSYMVQTFQIKGDLSPLIWYE